VLLPSKVLPAALPRWLTLHRTELHQKKNRGRGRNVVSWLCRSSPEAGETQDLSFASSAGQGDKTRWKSSWDKIKTGDIAYPHGRYCGERPRRDGWMGERWSGGQFPPAVGPGREGDGNHLRWQQALAPCAKLLARHGQQDSLSPVSDYGRASLWAEELMPFRRCLQGSPVNSWAWRENVICDKQQGKIKSKHFTSK